MASLHYAKQVADELVAEYGTRDPLEIIQSLDLLYYDRSDFQEILGMYAFLNDQGCIFTNASLEGEIRNMVLAHELGHDRLHRDIAAEGGIWDFSYCDLSGRIEYEANVFAAHLLVPEDWMLELLQEGYSAQDAATLMGVDERMVWLKLHEMQKDGKKFPFYNLSLGNFLYELQKKQGRQAKRHA